MERARRLEEAQPTPTEAFLSLWNTSGDFPDPTLEAPVEGFTPELEVDDPMTVTALDIFVSTMACIGKSTRHYLTIQT